MFDTDTVGKNEDIIELITKHMIDLCYGELNITQQIIDDTEDEQLKYIFTTLLFINQEIEYNKKLGDELELFKQKNILNELQQKESKEFLYMIVHNLKSPINNLKILFNLFYDSLTDDQKHIKNMIMSSIENLETNVLNILQIAEKTIVSEKKEIQLDTLINNVVDHLNQIISNTETTIHIDAPDNIYIDEIRFSSVLQNLIINSIKYSKPAQKPVIEIRSEDTKYFKNIIFKDYGIGIQESKIETIFDFMIRDNQMKEGHGIGLAYCKKIIENHGGTIICQSNINEGTTFHMQIPKKID